MDNDTRSNDCRCATQRWGVCTAPCAPQGRAAAEGTRRERNATESDIIRLLRVMMLKMMSLTVQSLPALPCRAA